MIALLARLQVAEGKEEEFEKVMLGLAAEVRANEPGNHLYTLVKDDEGYAVMELYDDDEALGGARRERSLQGRRRQVRRIDGGASDVDALRGRRLRRRIGKRHLPTAARTNGRPQSLGPAGSGCRAGVFPCDF